MENEEITAVVADRDRLIVRTSIIGIITNVFLAAFKAAIGLLSHSIAVVLDAVNNLSDALSSLITIIGTKLSAKLPDKKHPLGYGRIEYLTALVVAAIVLYAGATSLVESVKKIIHPETADYSLVSLVIIAVAVGVKLLLGRYVKAQGKGHIGAFLRRPCLPGGVQIVVKTDPAVGLGISCFVNIENGAFLEQLGNFSPELVRHGINDAEARKAAGGAEKTHVISLLITGGPACGP